MTGYYGHYPDDTPIGIYNDNLTHLSFLFNELRLSIRVSNCTTATSVRAKHFVGREVLITEISGYLDAVQFPADIQP